MLQTFDLFFDWGNTCDVEDLRIYVVNHEVIAFDAISNALESLQLPWFRCVIYLIVNVQDDGHDLSTFDGFLLDSSIDRLHVL